MFCARRILANVLILTIGFSFASALHADEPKAASKEDKSSSKKQDASAKPDLTPVVAGASRVHKDIPYVQGGAARQRLDVYAPAGVRWAPVLIFLHGGEWTKGDKSDVSMKPKFFNEHGVIFVSVNYRLSGTAPHPAQVNDVAAAIRWVHDHIAKYGGDPERLVLMGHSAGCHLATLTGLDPRPLATVNLKPSDLRGVVSWSGGAFDLVQKVKDGGMYAGYIRKTFGKDEAAWRDASPMNHVNDFKSPPQFLFASAEGDKAPSQAASKKMTAMIQSAGGRADWIPLPGKTHATANNEIGKPGDGTGEILLRFVREATGLLEERPNPST